MMQHRRVCAEIDLDKLEYNLDQILKRLQPQIMIMAVIKADGYGHGAIPLARVMEKREEIWGYGVATAEEAFSLRKAGLKKPILILGYTFPEYYDELAALDVQLTVFDYESARLYAEAGARRNKAVHVHIKLDTGMGRIGFPFSEMSADEIERIAEIPNIIIEGIFTHFAKADEIDKSYTKSQVCSYEKMLLWLYSRSVYIQIHHVSNSAGIVDIPAYNLNMVRAGIILYGLWPSADVCKDKISLKPILSLKSHVVYVKTMQEGQLISYGGTYQTKKRQRIATIPVGYGDGYPRSLSNKGYVLIHGQRANICGRICMDQFMVDVTDIGGVSAGDEVTLIGTDGDETITMEQLGDLSGRFNYEFACDLGKRIPRVYYQDGKIVEEVHLV